TEANFYRAHEVAERAEANFQEGFPELETITLHYEPQHKPYRRSAYLLDEDQTTLVARFGATRWIRLNDQDRDGSILSSRVVHSPIVDGDRHRGIRLGAWLIAQGTDEIHLRSSEIESALQNLLEAAGVSVIVDTQDMVDPLVKTKSRSV
ncbi:MAG: cation diffusion facilitator family transporter, partial [Acidithiobacillus sp.]